MIRRMAARVAVIGAGSAGLAAARGLADAGHRVTLVTDGLVGGECPYLACIPSKAMLHAAAAGRSWDDAVAFRDEAAHHRDDHDSADAVQERGVELVRGRASVAARHRLRVVVDGGEREVAFDDLVVATGAGAVTPPVDGLDGVGFWTSEDALSRPDLPERPVILGGGPIGCELAQIYAGFGADVTLVETERHLLPREPAFVGEQVAAALARGGVRVMTGTAARRVSPTDHGAAVVDLRGEQIRTDRVLVATGKRPRTDGLDLERLGVRLTDAGAVVIDDRCAAAAGVWAIGDVTAIAPWTHWANRQARAVVTNITGDTVDRVDARGVPRTVFTDPAVCCVGTTPDDPEDVAAAGLVREGIDLDDLARGRVDERHDGRIELWGDPEQGLVVGGAAVGPMADAWMHEIVLAVHARVPLATLCDTVHAFPTWNEAVGIIVERLAAACHGCRATSEPARGEHR
jgi:dihydrolipoamide dehydrogenase